MSTPNLAISLIASNSASKEIVANSAFTEFDGAITDLLIKALSDADYTLVATEGGEALAHMAFRFTGTLTAGRNIIVPTRKKLYYVQNATTGGFSLTVKTASGTGIVIAPSSTTYTSVYCDGTNVVAAGGSSNVTNSAGALTAHAVILGNGGNDVKAATSLGTTTTVLHGNASGDPSFAAVTESDQLLSDVTTGNVSTSAHGYAPKAPNDATKFLDGTGNYSVPGGGGGGSTIYTNPMTPPLVASFTFVSASGATDTDKSNRMLVQIPDTVQTLLFKNSTIPSTPYTVEIGFCVNSQEGAGTFFVAVNVFDTTANPVVKALSCQLLSNAGTITCRVVHYTDLIGGAGSVVANKTIPFLGEVMTFLRITDDGTNTTYWVSLNGLDFTQVFQEATGGAGFITPNHTGMAFLNSLGSSLSQAVSVYHFKEANSILPQFAA